MAFMGVLKLICKYIDVQNPIQFYAIRYLNNLYIKPDTMIHLYDNYYISSCDISFLLRNKKM